MAIGDKLKVVMATEKDAPGGVASLDEECKIAVDTIPDNAIDDQINSHNISTDAHIDIRGLITTHTTNTSNPHNVTKSQLGLENVENKSSATIRGELTKENVVNALGYTPGTSNSDTTYDIADNNNPGLVKSGGDVTVETDGTMSVNDNSHKHTVSNISDFPTSMPASDVKDWAKADDKPTYTASEVGADVAGAAATALADAKSYTDSEVARLVNTAPETMDTIGELAEAMENNKTVVEALNSAIGTKANQSDLTTHTGNTSNPHNVTAEQVGLGNVGNFKAVSTVANQGLTDEEKANARANIGAGASSFSGDYNDLSNKPTIPSAVTESTVSGWGFTKNTGTYSKPTGGIPKTDLANDVQTSLNNATIAKTHADSAHAPSNAQANIIETIKVNGQAIIPENKTVDITVPEAPPATSSKAGIVKIYEELGTNTDGTMTQKAITDAIGSGGSGSSSAMRKSIVLDSDNVTSINIPFTINDTDNLVVYLNGVLLVPSIHYTSTTTQITLTGYEGKFGDIVTFIGNDSVSTSLEVLATEVGIQDAAGNFPDANSVENALIQLANTTKNVVKSDIDTKMNAKFVAQNNTDYSTKQVRNIFLVAKSDAETSMPQGSSGDICIVYNDD